MGQAMGGSQRALEHEPPAAVDFVPGTGETLRPAQPVSSARPNSHQAFAPAVARNCVALLHHAQRRVLYRQE
jgi:hypothetical protein